MSSRNTGDIYRCPHCQGTVDQQNKQYWCSECEEVVGEERDPFTDFMLDVELDEDFQEFYEGEGTEGDDEGGPRISAQQFKVPNILTVLADDDEPDRWLDMGCGGGWILERLLEEWSPKKTVGLDISETRLQEARRRNPSTHFVRAPVENVPYPDDAFDLITSLDVIEHIPDPGKLLDEAHRLAERLVIKFPIEDTWFDRFQKEFWWPMKRRFRGEDPGDHFEPHLHRFHFEDARQLLRDHGFTIVDEHISEHPFEDNHATMYPLAYNITGETPWLKKLDFHLKRAVIVGSMRVTYRLAPQYYYNIFNSGIYLHARRSTS